MGGMEFSLFFVNLSDTGQSQTPVSSCMWKTVDSPFLRMLCHASCDQMEGEKNVGEGHYILVMVNSVTSFLSPACTPLDTVVSHLGQQNTHIQASIPMG